MILPLFQSNYSALRSLLTYDEPTEIDPAGQVSVLSVCKKHDIRETFCFDTRFSGFPTLYKNAKKAGVSARFGIKLTLTADIEDKSEASLKTESQIIIWMNCSEGYQYLIKIYSKSFIDGFYYRPRLDIATLRKMWHSSLSLMCPPFDNTIHNNQLKSRLSIPDFNGLAPTMTFARMELPFDSLLIPAIKQFAEANKLGCLEVHPIYYYVRADFDAYLALRCIGNKSHFDSPGVDFLCSREFCYEAYEEKTKSPYKN